MNTLPISSSSPIQILKSAACISVLLAILTVGCTSKESTVAEEALLLYQESMKLHDEVMPRMDEMFKLENKLKSLRDSLSADTVANASGLAEVNASLTALDKAGKGMMDWMHNIQDVPGNEDSNAHAHHDSHEQPSSSTPEEILNIQKAQKESIEKVKKDIEESIANATELLNNK